LLEFYAVTLNEVLGVFRGIVIGTKKLNRADKVAVFATSYTLDTRPSAAPAPY
jgi:hypothetical protein